MKKMARSEKSFASAQESESQSSRTSILRVFRRSDSIVGVGQCTGVLMGTKEQGFVSDNQKSLIEKSQWWDFLDSTCFFSLGNWWETAIGRERKFYFQGWAEIASVCEISREAAQNWRKPAEARLLELGWNKALPLHLCSGPPPSLFQNGEKPVASSRQFKYVTGTVDSEGNPNPSQPLSIRPLLAVTVSIALAAMAAADEDYSTKELQILAELGLGFIASIFYLDGNTGKALNEILEADPDFENKVLGLCGLHFPDQQEILRELTDEYRFSGPDGKITMGRRTVSYSLASKIQQAALKLGFDLGTIRYEPQPGSFGSGPAVLVERPYKSPSSKAPFSSKLMPFRQ